MFRSHIGYVFVLRYKWSDSVETCVIVEFKQFPIYTKLLFLRIRVRKTKNQVRNVVGPEMLLRKLSYNS